MKKLILLMIISSFTILQSCSSKGETYEGEWVSHDFNYSFDIECDCTPEEKNEMMKIADEAMELKFSQYAKATSVNFSKDHTFEGSILGQSTNGTYKATDKELTLIPEGYPEETLDVKNEGEKTIFSYALDKDDLEGIEDSTVHPDYGEIKVVITELKFEMIKKDPN